MDWTYLQTPQFTISTKSQAVLDVDLTLTVRYGAITGATLTVGHDTGASSTATELSGNIIGHKIHETASWEAAFGTELDQLDLSQRTRLCEWLDQMLPRNVQ